MENNYKAQIEAILFTMGESVEISKIANALEIKPGQVKKIVKEMQKELETPIRLATDDFGKEVYWGYDQIIAVKQKYLEQNQKFKNEITTFEASCKKRKKEINLNNKRIAKNEMYINYLDYILRGFEHTITDLQKSIDKAMNICDGF